MALPLSRSRVVEEFAGFPFLDINFRAGRLLTAVACTRWARAHGLDQAPEAAQLQSTLQPAEARRIRALDLALDLPTEDLTSEQQERAAGCLARTRELIPEWAPLLSIPVRLHQLVHSEAVSASVFAWPQYVFLGEAAFSSDANLTEQLVHEHSHQWLYFIEELWPLAAGEDRWVLPSGTAHRSTSELLGAVHVVVNLHRLWQRTDVDSHTRERRLLDLAAYGRDCLPLLAAARPGLTSEGAALADRLRREVSGWS
ncbi:aKG-HExxH-type peptide beta-hydroxylase [Micromonospora chokoriensis]